MSALTILAGVAVIALLVYLFFALFQPERF